MEASTISQSNSASNKDRFRGPHAGIVAIVFTVLFNYGLSFVISLSGTPPYFPGPWESSEVIATYFQNQSHDVLMCSLFQLGSAVPLGILTVTLVSRLRFLGIKTPGTYISLFGGFMAAFNLALSAHLLWVMSYPGIAQDAAVIRTLYYAVYEIGGVGYSVPLGLLIAGIAISAAFLKFLPKWLVWSGILIAIFGVTSWLSLVVPKLLYLIPLTRFPGFIWLIIVGFKLSRTGIKHPSR